MRSLAVDQVSGSQPTIRRPPPNIPTPPQGCNKLGGRTGRTGRYRVSIVRKRQAGKNCGGAGAGRKPQFSAGFPGDARPGRHGGLGPVHWDTKTAGKVSNVCLQDRWSRASRPVEVVACRSGIVESCREKNHIALSDRCLQTPHVLNDRAANCEAWQDGQTGRAPGKWVGGAISTALESGNRLADSRVFASVFNVGGGRILVWTRAQARATQKWDRAVQSLEPPSWEPFVPSRVFLRRISGGGVSRSNFRSHCGQEGPIWRVLLEQPGLPGQARPNGRQ